MFKTIKRNIDPFGELKYKRMQNVWFGTVENICPKNSVELSIVVKDENQDLSKKIELVKELAVDYNSIISNLYDLVYKKYKGTQYEVTRTEIENMFFLTAVDLKDDNKTWWLVLEPSFSPKSAIYDYFLRFTMIDRKVIWQNFDINTTA